MALFAHVPFKLRETKFWLMLFSKSSVLDVANDVGPKEFAPLIERLDALEFTVP